MKLPADRGEEPFDDYKPPYTAAQAILEANRCLYCADPPCVRHCPTGIDIPRFIRKIATGNTWGSAKTIFSSNILGMSCARVCPVEELCVGACVENAAGITPISIGRLQRFATDEAFRKGWRFFTRGADTGKTVALVGAGPASLAAAHELSRLGHRCVIFDKRALPGGLNTTGVAPYKMKADRALEEVEWVLAIGGIEIRNQEVTDLLALEQQFDAVFLGIGLGTDTRLGIPGEDLVGVVGAVEWIEQMKNGHERASGIKRALVIGGGNTAMDVVRELATLGVPDVRLVYRGDEATMSGYSHEWDGARKLGVLPQWNSIPVAFTGDGKVTGARIIRTENRKPVAGSEYDLPADLVVLAIGQAKLGEMLANVTGVGIDKGRVLVDDNGRTGRKGWFAGGDCANGGKEVVNAVAEGKRAATAIHAHLDARGGSNA